MNLHAVAAGVTAAVNPLQPLVVQVSAGSIDGPDGVRVPVYRRAVTVYGDVQSLTYKDLQQIEGLNLQGTRRAIYFNGHVEGLVRVDRKGGDLITTQDGKVWLCAMVLEYWPNWSKCAVTLQDGS
jgi:hypothetical protein